MCRASDAALSDEYICAHGHRHTVIDPVRE